MEKVQITLKSAGDCIQIEQKSFKASKAQVCSKLFDLIRKALGLSQNQTVFMFYKEFAIYPDTTIGEILYHCPTVNSVDLYYSISPAFG